jgi:hypothetical protein
VVDCTVLASTAPGSPSTVVAQTSATMAGLTPGMRVHHDAYVELAGAAQLHQPLNSAPLETKQRAFCDLWDLAQSPYHIAPTTTWRAASTLLRNSILFSASRGVLIPPAEYMMLQGIPVPSLLDAGSEAAELYPFTERIEQLFPKTCDVRMLAGNGMHVTQIGTVFAFLLGMASQLHQQMPELLEDQNPDGPLL